MFKSFVSGAHIPYIFLALIISSCSGGGGSSNEVSSATTATTYSAATVAKQAADTMGTDGEVGILFAGDHGYSVRQIAEAIMAGRLSVEGLVTDSSGAEVTPEYTAPKTLDLGSLRAVAAPDNLARHFTSEQIEIMRGLVNLWLTIEQQETDDFIRSTLLAIGHGFLIDVIVEAIVGHSLDEAGNIKGKSPQGIPQTDVFTEQGAGSGADGVVANGDTGGDTVADELPGQYPISYSGYGRYTSTVTITWGGGGTLKCESQPLWEITLNADGTLSATFSMISASLYDTQGAQYCSESDPFKQTRTGTHSNGTFSISMYSDAASPALTGTYTANGIQGTWSYEQAPLVFSFGAATITETQGFNIVTVR